MCEYEMQDRFDSADWAMKEFDQRRVAMVDCQVRPSDVTNFNIIQAMLEIPREEFVPDAFKDLAYMGEHVPIADHRVILDPRVLAKMLNELNVRRDELVLDVGCALGYSSAVIARMAEAVIALEEIDDFAEHIESTLASHFVDNAIAIAGSLAEGAPEHGPYDAMAIQGGVEDLPVGLSQQLKEGGRIAYIFVDGAAGECRVGVKAKGRISWRTAFNAHAPVLQGFKKIRTFTF